VTWQPLRPSKYSVVLVSLHSWKLHVVHSCVMHALYVIAAAQYSISIGTLNVKMGWQAISCRVSDNQHDLE
jgi:hypothetical protein